MNTQTTRNYMFNQLYKLTVFSFSLFILFLVMFSSNSWAGKHATSSPSSSNLSFLTATGDSEEVINSIVQRIKRIRRLITKKNYKLALKETHSAIIWNQEVPILYTLEGTIYFLLGKYENAKTSWIKSLKIKSDNLQSKRLLKKIEQKMRN